MPRKIKNRLSLQQELERIDAAAIKPEIDSPETAECTSLEERITKIVGLLEGGRKNNNMLFFVMYDIESNKVRRYIVKYLERNGCHRVQKSIFLADLPPEKYKQMKKDLIDVRSFYEGDDSILIVPISTDYLKAMSIIGKSLQMDVILRNKSTLFF